MKNNLFIPKVIKVGFQKRSDTYTQMLAYVIYYDEQGKLRKETSWENWRDKKIPDVEYDNEPIQGFVLNKKAGGYQYHYDMRQTYVRVFDPRGFEIEITIPNLLYILENTNSIKGKGLEGEFVYSWDGKDIVLMPVDSPDYKMLMDFNNKKFNNDSIKGKDLKIGATYLDKNNEEIVYLGKFPKYGSGYKFKDKYFPTIYAMYAYAEKNNLTIRDHHNYDYQLRTYRYDRNFEHVENMDHGNHYWFEKVTGKFDYQQYKILKSVPKGYLIEVLSEEPIADYSDRYEKLQHDYHFSPIDYEANRYEPYESVEEFTENCVGWLRKWYAYIDEKIVNCNLVNRKLVDDVKYFDVHISDGQKIESDHKMTIEEIFNKYQPRYLVRYLKNGKEYKRYK